MRQLLVSALLVVSVVCASKTLSQSKIYLNKAAFAMCRQVVIINAAAIHSVPLRLSSIGIITICALTMVRLFPSALLFITNLCIFTISVRD